MDPFLPSFPSSLRLASQPHGHAIFQRRWICVLRPSSPRCWLPGMGKNRQLHPKSSRYDPCPPAAPVGTAPLASSTWFWNLAPLIGPWGSQESKQMPGPRHVFCTCQLMKQLEGARLISGPRAIAKGRCRKDRLMSSKLLLGVHTENRKGKLALAKIE